RRGLSIVLCAAIEIFFGGGSAGRAPAGKIFSPATCKFRQLVVISEAIGRRERTAGLSTFGRSAVILVRSMKSSALSGLSGARCDERHRTDQNSTGPVPD